MCLGENSAHHAVHYVNAQLTALWENSVECTEHAGKNLKPLERVRYDFALREFHVGSKQLSKTTGEPESMFSAVFDRPRVDFICNHEAVLYLKIKEGHFNRDFAKIDVPTFAPTRARNVQIKDLELAFRLDFTLNTIKGTTAHIGNGAHLIQLLVLNVATATLASKVDITDAKDALAFYLKQYLEFLRHAGHHVLFSLPDFDDDGHQVQVEFSLLPHFIRNIEHEITEVFGVSLDTINNSLSSRWLKSIMEAEDEGDHDKEAICLAEYRSTWTTIGDRKDIQFLVKFGAPTLKILCKREAILSFVIEELIVYDGNDFTVAPKHTYKNWEIATIVNLIKKVEGSITRIELDYKTLRVCEPLCIFADLDISITWAATLKATIFEFFQIHYTTILHKISAHIVYLHDEKHGLSGFPGIHLPHINIPGIGLGLGGVGLGLGLGSGGSPGPSKTHDNPGHGHSQPKEPGKPNQPVVPGVPTATEPGAEVSKEVILRETSVADYDFLQVISVEGILEHFKTLWQSYKDKTEDYARVLVKWSHGEDIAASFGAITLKFLSKEKAMVWIHLEDGSLKPLKGDKRCQFIDWSIAFEVNVTVVEHDKVVKKSKSWFERFKDSFAWKLHGDQESRTLHHLGLDFSSAKFVYDKSRFEGLALGSRTAVGYIRAVVQYLTKYYFDELTQHGHHILYTTPVWKAGFKPPSWGLTSLSFQIYSKYTYTRETVDFSTAVVILLGMTSFHKHPKGPLPYSSEWVVGGGGAAGTVCLSRQVFFEERLLKSLAEVNGKTTVVPNFCPSSAGTAAAIFTGADESEWGLALATWIERSCTRKKASRCDWKVNVNKSESDYKWEYTDKWSYEHENSHDPSRNGSYKVSCITKNFLSFPAAQEGSLDIVLKGSVQVELAFKGSKSWASHLQSTWASTLSIKSLPGGSGLSIEVAGDDHPKFDTISTDIPIEELFDIKALHGLLHIELSSLASELRQSFGGVWEHCFAGTNALALCNPFFNKRGDILFELRPYVPLTQTQIVARPSVARTDSTKKPSWIRRAVHTVGEVIGDVIDDGKINRSNRSNGTTSESFQASATKSEKEVVSTPTAEKIDVAAAKSESVATSTTSTAIVTESASTPLSAVTSAVPAS